ncbi:hypothetical protein CES85_3741 (plasmid) [Ochrobactrum quorumnocens]|uniref:Uncharacterized protein n=1 Tax=Ochrobactrum quorumnocens TaxID=271865 RepID=A0A248UNI3_9HYPH|nr:hypothetical protein CES85_3741 [[Ochrobactrum] quorumnocens]
MIYMRNWNIVARHFCAKGPVSVSLCGGQVVTQNRYNTDLCDLDPNRVYAIKSAQ